MNWRQMMYGVLGMAISAVFAEIGTQLQNNKMVIASAVALAVFFWVTVWPLVTHDLEEEVLEREQMERGKRNDHR